MTRRVALTFALFLPLSLPLVADAVLRVVGSRAGPNCSRPSRPTPFSPHPSGRGLKGSVGGTPHRAHIGRALFHRARSASTGAPTPTRSPTFFSLLSAIHRGSTGGAVL